MSEPQLQVPLGWRVQLVLAWYDCWVGLYWNGAKRILYIRPLPMVGVAIHFGAPASTHTEKP